MAEGKKKGKTLDIVARHNYRDASGAVIYQIVRCADGTKRVRSPDPKDPSKWRWGRAKWGVTAVPYRLPEIIARAKKEPLRHWLWIVPDERDADLLASHGIEATCAIWDGEPRDNGWKREWSGWLKDYRAFAIIARNDPPPDRRDAKGLLNAYLGQRRAEQARLMLEPDSHPGGLACLTLPDLDGRRVDGPTAWLDNGGTVGGLIAAVRAAPPWQCPDPLDGLSVDELERLSAAHGSTGPGHGSRAAASTPPAPPPGAASAATPHTPPAPAAAGRGEAENVGGEPAERQTVSYLRGALIGIMANADLASGQKKKMLCDAVTAWMNGRGKFFYDLNDKTHEAAMWFDAVEKRLHRVNQDYFASWLARATAFNRELRDFKFFKAAVEDESLVGDGTAGVEPRRYWARQGQAVYLSCGEGRAVRVTAAGVEAVDNGTDDVVFEQGYALEPWRLLPEEASFDPFERCGVFRDMATTDGRGKTLLKLWFCSMFAVTGWKPLLVLTGTVGSGKTRVAVALFELLGMPSRVSAIDALGNIKDFWSSIDKGGLYVLDNADHHIQWLPDALSVISTGGTFEKKKLYTDTTTITQKARCWAVVTSANPTFASDAGLADRLITIQLERVERETAESALTREIAEARDAGLSWICHAMRKALADASPVPKGLNRRHPDWAEWAFRLGRATGDEEEARRAISENEAFKSVFALQNDALGRFLLSGLAGGFEGSVSELGQRLASACEGYSREMWTDAKIGKALKRMDAHLRGVFRMEKLNHGGRAHYKFSSPVFDAADAPASPPPDAPLLFPTPHNVGVVGGGGAKVAGNTIIHDFYTHTPHTPNIVGGEVEIEEESAFCAVPEDNGWDNL